MVGARPLSLGTAILSLASLACDGVRPVEPSVEPSVEARLVAASGSTLSAPSNLAAVAESANRINLSWHDNSTNETGFEIYRSTTGATGGYALLAATGASVASYSDSGLLGAKQYCYEVRAYKQSGGKTSYSSFSGVACATTPPSGPPAAPVNVNARPLSSESLLVSWSAGSTDQGGFLVERSADSGTTWFDTLNVGLATSFTFPATAEQLVCFRVVAWNVKGDSPPSTMDCTAAPAGPTDLTIAFDSATSLVELAWTDHSAVEDGYEVYLCHLPDPGLLIYSCGWVESLPANTTTSRFSWTGAFFDYFYVVATKDGGYSDPSGPAYPY